MGIFQTMAGPIRFSLLTGLALGLPGPATAQDPSPSKRPTPSGSIAFASLAPKGWDLYAVEVATGKTKRWTNHPRLDFNAVPGPDGRSLAFVSERNGIANLYRLDLGPGTRTQLTDTFALDDHPTWSPDGQHLAFASTRQPAAEPGRSWSAIYRLDLMSENVNRISPPGASDFSPAWSPRGDRIAFASGSGRSGSTDLMVMAPDGSNRRTVLENAGWPAFAPDGKTLYVHREINGNWGLWRVGLDGGAPERITSADADVFTPRVVSPDGSIVASVQQGGHRQIARIDPESGDISPLTSAPTDHWNPAPSPDGRWVFYHRQSDESAEPNLEEWAAPSKTNLRLFEVAGSFPAFSPDGQQIALTGGSFSRLDLMNSDGSDRQTLVEGEHRALFSIAWGSQGAGIAFAQGPVFQGASTNVDLFTIQPDGENRQRLTTSEANDAFPNFSPDGQRLVFRSGRDGHKNLFIMNRDGSSIQQLTKGEWTDTMPTWSPDGDRIVFASDRDGNFDLWSIQADGTGLKKLLGGGGRDNHPRFSPDGHWIVFTSQRAGLSAEPTSRPDQPQPYGDLFMIRPDGTGLTRLTHTAFEEGTPDWGISIDGELTEIKSSEIDDNH